MSDKITGVDGAIVNTRGGGQVLVRRGERLPAIDGKEHERLEALGAFNDETPRERAVAMPTADPIALAAENAALRAHLSTLETDTSEVEVLRSRIATLEDEADGAGPYIQQLEAQRDELAARVQELEGQVADLQQAAAIPPESPTTAPTAAGETAGGKKTAKK
jgi:hypothetical protein